MKTYYNNDEVEKILEKFPKANFDIDQLRHFKFLICVDAIEAEFIGNLSVIVKSDNNRFNLLDISSNHVGYWGNWFVDIKDLFTEEEVGVRENFILVTPEVREFCESLENLNVKEDESGLY